MFTTCLRASIVIALAIQACTLCRAVVAPPRPAAGEIDGIRGGAYGDQCDSQVTNQQCLSVTCAQTPCATGTSVIYDGNGVCPGGIWYNLGCTTGSTAYTSQGQSYPVICQSTLGNSANAIGCVNDGSTNFECGSYTTCNVCSDNVLTITDPCNLPTHCCSFNMDDSKYYCTGDDNDSEDYEAPESPPEDPLCGNPPG